MPVCPKCHEFISESHYGRHLKRCGTHHQHQTQSLYVPSATPQIESPNRGITYGPHSRSRSWDKRWKWIFYGLVVFIAAVILLGEFVL